MQALSGPHPGGDREWLVPAQRINGRAKISIVDEDDGREFDLQRFLDALDKELSFKPDPANDPNDAYAVIPTPAELRGSPVDWWTVTHNGVPVWHYPPDKRELADRFATDPAYRQRLTSKRMAHE